MKKTIMLFSFVFFIALLNISCLSAKETTALILNIWPNGAPIGDNKVEQVEVKLHIWLPEKEKATGKGVVICPGGGYQVLCMNTEGYPIAEWLQANGIAGFILEYRLPKGRNTVPLSDAQRAIRTVRAHAAEWNVSPDKIGIIGFSAGGHLASTAITHFDKGNEKSTDPVERVSCRPDFGILIYPVITMYAQTHCSTCKNLLGDNPSDELKTLYSNHLQVGRETPRIFMVHATDDTVVPIVNSLMFEEKMKEFNRPVLRLEPPKGGHGLFGCKGPVWEEWKKACIEWMKTF